MKLLKNTKTILFVFAFAATFSAFAQENNSLGALITDRPDQTESPNTVPKGYLQVETGAMYESFKEANLKNETYTYNTTLLRFGLLENLELRLGWDFVEGKSKLNGNVLNNGTSGFNPLLLGAKIGIAKEKDCFPEIGFLGHLSLPFFAGNDYKPQTTGVDFRFAFSHTLSETTSLSYNIGAAWEGGNPEASYVYTIAYGFGITDKLGSYVEIYGDMPENHSANHFWDAGFTYLISDNVQLDTTIGTSLTKGQDLLLSAGLSFRLPTTKN